MKTNTSQLTERQRIEKLPIDKLRKLLQAISKADTGLSKRQMINLICACIGEP